MKLNPTLCLFLLAISLVSAKKEFSSFFGTIKTVEDCGKFNLDPVKNIARASAAFVAARPRGIWKINGEKDQFLVEECYAKITNPEKAVLFTVEKDLEKLKLFPVGPGWLHVNVAQGPNGPTFKDDQPLVVDDSSFKAVVFGLAESETGGDSPYTREQILRLIKKKATMPVHGEKYIMLNSVIMMRSTPDVFIPITEEGPVGVLVYQTEEAAIDRMGIAFRLGTSDIHFLMDVSDKAYFSFPGEGDSQDGPNFRDDSTMVPDETGATGEQNTEDHHTDEINTDGPVPEGSQEPNPAPPETDPPAEPKPTPAPPAPAKPSGALTLQSTSTVLLCIVGLISLIL